MNNNYDNEVDAENDIKSKHNDYNIIMFVKWWIKLKFACLASADKDNKSDLDVDKETVQKLFMNNVTIVHVNVSNNNKCKCNMHAVLILITMVNKKNNSN